MDFHHKRRLVFLHSVHRKDLLLLLAKSSLGARETREKYHDAPMPRECNPFHPLLCLNVHGLQG
jgi:hypothetical protein